MSLSIYSSFISPRLTYILDFICAEFLHCEYRLFTSVEQYKQASAPFLNYSQQRILVEECFIPSCNLLKERKISAPVIHTFQHDGLVAFFQTESPTADFPFDLFALQFFLLSRLEEYLPFKPDAHQRFGASESLAFKSKFLHLPLVDLWALKLVDQLKYRFPQLSLPNRKFRFCPSYDIDMAWSYLHKNNYRFWGGLLKDLFNGKFALLGERIKVKAGFQSDPYFTFSYMDKLHQRFQIQPYYFWLLGDRGTYDKNISTKNIHFQELLKKQSERYEFGIHPSYQSNENQALLKVEKNSLEEIIGKTIFRSRQHFLKLRFPDTYRSLLAANIEEDYTMGYPEEIGFRASTACPFFWYDLEKEEQSALKVIPLAIMDVSLQQYMGLSPDQAIEKIKELLATTRKVKGTFSTLWHNTSFVEREAWEGWRRVYETMLEEVIQEKESPELE